MWTRRALFWLTDVFSHVYSVVSREVFSAKFFFTRLSPPQIAERETEIEGLVSEARQRSNRRVRRRGEQLDAGNELEEALLELEVEP